jgi:hypothetical protein
MIPPLGGARAPLHGGTRAMKGVLLLCVVFLVATGCGKGEGGSAGSGSAAPGAAQKAGPILTKPLDKLTKEDLAEAVKKLGWESGGQTWSGSGEQTNIIASGMKEDPAGVDSPDGKKRLHMSIGVYREKADTLAGQKKSLEERGQVTEVQGNYILTVSCADGKGDRKEDAQKMLKELLGK